MKHLLLLFGMCIAVSVSAAGQSVIGPSPANSRPQMVVLQDDAQHASQAGMAPESDLREHGGSSYARGERPLWEVMPPPRWVSLGEVARQLRLEHATVPKAAFIWVN